MFGLGHLLLPFDHLMEGRKKVPRTLKYGELSIRCLIKNRLYLPGLGIPSSSGFFLASLMS